MPDTNTPLEPGTSNTGRPLSTTKHHIVLVTPPPEHALLYVALLHGTTSPQDGVPLAGRKGVRPPAYVACPVLDSLISCLSQSGATEGRTRWNMSRNGKERWGGGPEKGRRQTKKRAEGQPGHGAAWVAGFLLAGLLQGRAGMSVNRVANQCLSACAHACTPIPGPVPGQAVVTKEREEERKARSKRTSSQDSPLRCCKCTCRQGL